MAKFLNTQGASDALIRIIKDAKKRIVIISPYLQINDLIKEEIRYKVDTSRDIEVWLIYREDKLRPNDREWLDSMPSIKRGLSRKLHAKCYMNEKEAILTSMNLYEYSQSNNYEMGILVSSSFLGNDNDAYKEIHEESLKLALMSGIIQGTTEKEAAAVLQAPEKGYCIRCKADLPVNPTQLDPYCRRCKAIWNRFKNEKYEENHCHTCGNEHTTTKAKPLCPACYRKYKDVLEFAVS